MSPRNLKTTSTSGPQPYEIIQEARRLGLDVQRYERQIEEYDQALRRATNNELPRAFFLGVPCPGRST